MEKFVVIGAKKMKHNGSRVMSRAGTREEAEKALIQIQECAHLADCGPFSIITATEAEKKRLYGD